MVPEVWGDVWMPRHHVLTRLAKYFHVAWMNPPADWRDAVTGSGLRPKHPGDTPDLNTDVPEYPGFHVIQPGRLLPNFYRPRALAESMERLRIHKAARRLK